MQKQAKIKEWNISILPWIAYTHQDAKSGWIGKLTVLELVKIIRTVEEQRYYLTVKHMKQTLGQKKRYQGAEYEYESAISCQYNYILVTLVWFKSIFDYLLLLWEPPNGKNPNTVYGNILISKMTLKIWFKHLYHSNNNGVLTKIIKFY